MLRRIFELKREDVAGRPRKLHDEELHNFHSSPDVIRGSTELDVWDI